MLSGNSRSKGHLQNSSGLARGWGWGGTLLTDSLDEDISFANYVYIAIKMSISQSQPMKHEVRDRAVQER